MICVGGSGYNRPVLPPARKPIRPLPERLVNQIAAGEVVERPASVVKELIENALDAGATRVRIDLEGGGVDLVRVSDDGAGIPADELPLALAPHATSKIAAAEDLVAIATLGFRGEALASIASVSRVRLCSRPPEQAEAAEILAEGGVMGAVRPAGGPPGTTVEVRTLFFNTPARRKFLRSPATEQARCLDVVHTLAMAHPRVAFAFSADGRLVFECQAGESLRERILAVLGPDLEPDLLEVDSSGSPGFEGARLCGMVGTPAVARASTLAQYVLLNGRAVRDRTVQHALREAYRGLLDAGRYPVAVLALDMDPAMVDVNVHPAKAEVRFRDPSLVHALVLRTVREVLWRADLTPRYATAAGMRAWVSSGEMLHRPPASTRPAPPPAEALVQILRGTGPAGTAATAQTIGGVAESDPGGDVRASGASPGQEHAPPPLSVGEPAPRVLQVHNSYLVVEDDDGVLIVDQHALHERVIFEQLLARVRDGPLESQRLLMPAVVHVPPARMEHLAALTPLMARLGIEVDAIAPHAVAVHAFPTFLLGRGVEPGAFVGELIERAAAEGFVPQGEAVLRRVLDMMACKAAVKAGDRLSDAELAELLRLRSTVERAESCPHGRPTSVRLTMRELERLFRRT